MVGKGAEAEMVAKLGEQGNMALELKVELIIPSGLVIDPDSSIVAAADVVEAIVMAAGGRGWL